MPYTHARAPIYGYMKGYRHTIPLHLVHYARTFNIMRLLNRMPLGKVINVGGAEGYHSHLIQRLFGVQVDTLDLNRTALNVAEQRYGLPTIEASATEIPCEDNAYDTALCIETIEHISKPQEVVNELKRVAARNVIISTESFFDSQDQKEQFLLYLRETHPQFFRQTNPVQPGDVSHFTHQDFRRLFDSENLAFYPQFRSKQMETPGTREEVANKVREMADAGQPSRVTKAIVHYGEHVGKLLAKTLPEEDLLQAIVRTEPDFSLDYDAEMRAEDEQNEQRVRQWHAEKALCKVVHAHDPCTHKAAQSVPTLHIEEEGAQDMSIQWLLGDDLERSPGYSMRRVRLGPGGNTAWRCTSWEHQIYILCGEVEL